MHRFDSRMQSIINIVLALSLFAVSLSLARVIIFQNVELLFMLWNGFLAWLPFLLSLWLLVRWNKKRYLPKALTYMVLLAWLLFLPNAFYVITDFVHIANGDGFEAMYDILLMFTYSLLGVILGLTSLHIVHTQATHWYGKRARFLPWVILPLVGIAIYVGRYLRWNSWDVVLRPHVLVSDTATLITSNKVQDLFATIVLFSVFYGVLYWIFCTYIYPPQDKTRH